MKSSKEITSYFCKTQKRLKFGTTQTQDRLENTLSLVSETLSQVQSTKDKYEAVQKAWDDAIDRLADKAA